MYDEYRWIQILMMLGAYGPPLLALGAGFIMVFRLSPSNFRRLGLAGLALLFGCHLLRAIVLTLLPRIMLDHSVSTLVVYTYVVPAIMLIFALLEALGYGLLLMALVRALRQLRAAPIYSAR